MDNKKLPNYKTDEGKWYLIHCYKCNRENYALNVAFGICTWCGDNLNKEEENK